MRGHQVVSYTSNIGRGNTSATVLFTIPPQSTIVGIQITGPKSNASVTAGISIGSSGGGGADFLTSFDVKNNGGVSLPSSSALGYYNDLNPIQVTGTYAETGSASNAGGPWLVRLDVI